MSFRGLLVYVSILSHVGRYVKGIF